MADRTASTRVSRYRAAHRERGMGRVEVVVPLWAVAPMKAAAANLRAKEKRLDAAKPMLEAVLTTVNAPRPRHMDPETLLECIASPQPVKAWERHMQALFNEVPIEALHRFVLTGVVDFEDLNRAARVWRVQDGDVRRWIAEMADFRLAGPTPQNVRTY